MSHSPLVLPKVWATAISRLSPEDRIPPSEKDGLRQDGYRQDGYRKTGYRGRTCRKPPQPVAHAGFPSGLALRANAAELQLVPSPPALQAQPQNQPQTQPQTQAAPDVSGYRKYTEALLARYLPMSLDAGRVPSLMGRELFPGQVSHTRMHGFDDAVHFIHDFTNCLKLLSPGQQHLVRRVAMQGYSQSEVASMLGIGLRTVVRRYAEAIDRLTAILIERKLLEPNNLIDPLDPLDPVDPIDRYEPEPAPVEDCEQPSAS